MKKIFIIFSFIMILNVNSVSADSENYIFEFETVDNTGFNLETGVKIDEAFYSQTSKMVLPQNDGNVINLGLGANYHHLIWFDYYGKMLGYCNGGETTLETGYYLGDCGNNIEIPEEAYSFIIQNYNYTGAIDSLDSYYSAYYTANDLIFLTPQTVISITEAEDLDVNNIIDTFLERLNMNTTGGKIGIGISFMAILALIAGVLTKSAPVIIGVMILGFLVFTILGWFPIWITILLGIIVTFIILYKGNEG
jgi:hypothetical protein